MLATAADAPPKTDGWIFEKKFDGHRWIAVRRGDVVKLFTRRGIEVKDPHVVAALRMQEPENFIVDGEYVAGQFGGTDDHGYQIFDILSLDDEAVTGRTTRERSDLLHERFIEIGVVKLSIVHTDGEALFDYALACGWEGIMAKRADAPYRSGRSRNWLKVKTRQRQELVIGGYTISQNRPSLKSLVVGYYDTEGLHYAGRVGSGFTDPVLKGLRQALDQIRLEKRPFLQPVPHKHVRWVQPLLVCEVEFLEWTSDNRLRNPSFKGLRTDKPASQVTREVPES